MFSLKQLVVLALVGCTVATPLPHRRRPNQGNPDLPIGGRVQGTQGWGAPQGDGEHYVVVVTGTGSDNATPVNAAPATTTTAVAADTGSTGTNSGSDTGYMEIVNKWRTTMNRAKFTQDSKLEGNALKTANDGNGKMVHELNSGSFGQVLAPGSADSFEHVFVGGWLCERPSLPGLSQACQTQTKGWSHDGETGHADILSSTTYTKIGCALAKGIWACDVA